MFKKILNYFFYRKLAERTANLPHTIRLVSFSEAKHIGLIVGTASLVKEREALQKVFNLFDENNKTYCLIAICEENDLPASFSNIPQIIISKKELTYGKIPSEKALQKFENHKFDILIDLNQNNNKTAFFLENTIDAGLRIGKADSDRQPFVDLMIEWRDSDNVLQFVENIIHYLSMLVKEKPKK